MDKSVFNEILDNTSLLSRLGGQVSVTKEGVSISNAYIYDREGSNLIVEDIAIAFAEPGNAASLSIEYGSAGQRNHFKNTEVASMSDVVQVLSEETMPMTESEWIEAWESTEASKSGSTAVVQGRNALIVNEYESLNGEIGTLVIRIHLNTRTFKHYFNASHTEFYAVNKASFSETIDFLENGN